VSDDGEARLHRGQFVIGPEPVLVDEQWLAKKLTASAWLSHSPELPVTTTEDRDGVTWHLLGVAVQTNPARPSPPVEIRLARTSDLERLYHAWSGRWVLLGDGELHMDAAGLVGCFYRSLVRGQKGELWISSSPALIRRLPNRPTCAAVAPPLTGRGMDWYPPPRSRYESVFRLLPNQVLALSSPTVAYRVRTLVPASIVPASYSDQLDLLQQALTTALRNVASTEGTTWLPLTSGFDSRLLLALALHADLRVTAFTQQQPFPRMSKGDRVLPPRLAREVGFDHLFVERGKKAPRRLQLFDAHTALHAKTVDRDLFSRGQWDFGSKEDVVLRGGVFELGKRYYYKKLPAAVPQRARDIASSVQTSFRFDRFHADSDPHFKGIEEWAEWATTTSQPGVDWRDRFYLEQRLAGWLSSLEQGLDLVGYTRVHVANCHDVASLLMHLAAERRLGNRHHVDLIERTAPGLLQYPFNPPDSRVTKLAKRLRRRLHPRRLRRRAA
jgi:hypothetical protein